MFETKISLPWKRTGNKEYPENNQTCLIYFKHTGFSISRYEESENDEDVIASGYPRISHIFRDEGGFLGDEDVLWVPLTPDFPPFGTFNHIELPDSYVNDRDFMKWDDPRKILRWVELIEDHHWEDTYGLSLREELPKGTKIGVTEDRSEKEIIGVWVDKLGRLNQSIVLRSICKDIPA